MAVPTIPPKANRTGYNQLVTEHNALKAAYDAFAADYTLRSWTKQADFIIRKSSTGDTEAINGISNTNAGKVVYGGPADAGGVNGASASAVCNAVFADALANSVSIETGTYTQDVTIETPRNIDIHFSRGVNFRYPIGTRVPAWKINSRTRFTGGLSLSTVDNLESTDPDDVGILVYGRFGVYPSGMDSNLDNFFVSRFGTGLLIDTAWNNRFYNPYIYNCYDGVKITSTEGVDPDGFNSQFCHFFGGKIEESRHWPLWVDRGKYANFLGTYISSSEGPIMFDNVRGFYFLNCSFEATYDVDWTIDCFNTVPAYRESVFFDKCDWNMDGDVIHNNGVKLINASNWIFEQPTIAGLFAGKNFIDCSSGCSNIKSLDALIHSSVTPLTNLYIGDVIGDRARRLNMAIPFPIVANQTDKNGYYQKAQVASTAKIFKKLIVTVYPAPGAGESITVKLTDGIGNEMSVTISDTDYGEATIVGAYTSWVSSQIAVQYTSSAGCASTLGSVLIEYFNRALDTGRTGEVE